MYIKIIKYTRNFYKIILIFLYLLLPFYVLQAKIVSIEEPTFSTSIYRFNLNGTKCYSVSANPNNIIFVGNDEGILIYNGLYWNLIPTNEKCYNVLAEKDIIYFVSETFIGIIHYGKKGYEKINLPFKIKRNDKPRLISQGPELYLTANSSLFQVIGDKFKLINNVCADITAFNNKLYILDTKNSLYKLNGRQTEFIIDIGEKHKMDGFIQSTSNLWIKSGKNTLISVDPNSKFLKEYRINLKYPTLGLLKTIHLSDNKFLLVDSTQQVSLFDLATNRETEIQFSNPLTNPVNDIFSDFEGNIWILSNEGIVRLSFFEYVHNFKQLVNEAGNISLNSGKYLVYKNNGEFDLMYQDSIVNSFRLPDSTFNLILVGQRFVCYNTNEVLDFSSNDNIKPIEKGNVSGLFPSRLKYAGFYVICDNQLKLFFYTNNSWFQKVILRNTTISVKSLIEIDENRLLLLSNAGVIYKTDNQQQIKPVKLLSKGDIEMNKPWVSISRSNDHIFLQNYHSVFEYKPVNDTCIELICLKKLFKTSTFINQFIPLANKSAIISVHPIGGKQDIYLIKNILTQNQDNFIRIPNRLFDFGDIQQMFAYENNTIVFQGSKKSLIIDVPAFVNEPRSRDLILTKVFIFPDDSILFENPMGIAGSYGHINLSTKIDYVRFEIASTGYKSDNDVKFAFFLEGYDKGWSDWQNSSIKTYSYLNSGNYKLKVKALQNNGQVSDELILDIHVKSPVYINATAIKLYIILAILLVILYFIKRKRKFDKEKANLENIINRRTAELQREKEVTEELLANILPKDTVNQLINTGKASSQKFDMVTVLFSDIEGFTRIAEQMNPEMLIDELDNFFFHFDSVVEKYNIEKIKTIGDAYMCAGGIPYKNRTNPVEVVLAALEMQDYMRQLRQKEVNIWDLRIGIHTGAVIAGVVGHKKLSYDIWGDTVNTASRMESSGEASKINISGHTFDLVKDFFVCEYRGKMPVKYKGDIDMYFVKSIRPELSVDLKVIPNKKFFIQLQLLRLHDLEEFILERLTVELSGNYYFHTPKRTKDIHTLAELIARAEGISPEEMLFVRTTALLVDSGFVYNYNNHLVESEKFAREILPKFRYSAEQIEVICNLILAIDINSENPGKLESILWDAYLNYYGRVDYLEITLNLLNEIKHRTADLNEKEWWELQLVKIRNFRFKTSTGQLLREVSAEKQVQKVREYLNLF